MKPGSAVPFATPEAIAQKTLELLDTPAIRHAMRKRAYLYARDMVWKKAAQGYMGSFERARSERTRNPRVEFSIQGAAKSLDKLPAVKLESPEAIDRRYGYISARDFFCS